MTPTYLLNPQLFVASSSLGITESLGHEHARHLHGLLSAHLDLFKDMLVGATIPMGSASDIRLISAVVDSLYLSSPRSSEMKTLIFHLRGRVDPMLGMNQNVFSGVPSSLLIRTQGKLLNSTRMDRELRVNGWTRILPGTYGRTGKDRVKSLLCMLKLDRGGNSESSKLWQQCLFCLETQWQGSLPMESLN